MLGVILFSIALFIPAVVISEEDKVVEPELGSDVHYSVNIVDNFESGVIRGSWTVNIWVDQLLNEPDPDYDYYLIMMRVNDNTYRDVDEFHAKILVNPNHGEGPRCWSWRFLYYGE